MSFIIRNLTASPVVLDDLGITIPPSGSGPGSPSVAGSPATPFDFDAIDLQPNDLAVSTDLTDAITGGTLRIVSPLDDTTQLSIAQSLEVVTATNDSHWGIRAGFINQLEDVDTTGSQPGDVLQIVGSPAGTFQVSTVSSLVGGALLDDLLDVNTPRTNAGGSPIQWVDGVTYVLKANASNEVDAVALFGGSPSTSLEFCEAVQDIAGNLVQGGSPTPHQDIIVVYTDGAGQCDGVLTIQVADSYLRNDGDTLDSGTLDIATGADLTIQDLPQNPTDATNKEYVDSVAAGLDPKESVRAATTAEVGGTYTVLSGGSPAVPDTLTGVSAFFDGFQIDTIGDRVLIKDQPTGGSPNDRAQQNGIYVVTAVGAGSPLTVDLERASDQDGTPANEVSGGNFTFVENGNTLAGTGWVVVGDGILTLNTDDIIWVQFSESTVITAGIGLSQDGNTIDLDVNDLATEVTIAPSDLIAFHDGDGTPETSGSQTRNITVANFISALEIETDPISASDGVQIVLVGSPQTQDVRLDINGLPAESITGADELAFFNAVVGSPGAHRKTTATDFLADLRIVNLLGVPGGGIPVAIPVGSPQTLTYALRTITAQPLGSPHTGLNGLDVVNGDGVAGDPLVGLDIQNLPVRSDAIDPIDQIAVWNSTTGANEYYTVGEVAGAASSNSFETWKGSGNAIQFGTGSPATAGSPIAIVADTSTDTATMIGGDGILLTFNPVADSIQIEFNRNGLADTAVLLTDTFPFFDGSSTNDPEYRSFADLFNTDLNVVHGVDGTGIIIQTGGSPLFQTRSIVVDGVGLLDGLAIVDGDGIAGDPTIGLDITGTPAAGGSPLHIMAADDEFIGVNQSVVVGSPETAANQKFTGEEIAQGVSNILNLTNLTNTVINGQNVITIIDPSRGTGSPAVGKVLSIQETAVQWSDNTVNNNEWMQVGNSNDALAGFILPLDATLVRVTAHTADDRGNSKEIDLYIDGANNGAVISFVAVSGENEFIDETLNIDVDQGEKIRLRGDSNNGRIDDTIVTLWFKWRG